MENKKKFSCTVILTSCIKPEGIPFLKRSSENVRLEDYKKAFQMWSKNEFVDKIIFIENSGYDLNFFHQEAKKFPEKKIEILSCNENNNFDKSLGKGFGEHLCFKEILDKSKIFIESNFFVKVSGRYYINNYSTIIKEFEKKKSEIFIYLKNNLTYADSHFFGGSKNFFLNYVVPFSSKVDDTNNIYMENCLAKAALHAVNNNLKFNNIEAYPDIDGFIGTNNKEIKNNLIKKLKLYFFGKIKNYFYGNKRY